MRELAGRWFVQSAQAASANCGSQARLPWLCSHGPEAFDLKGVQALTHSPTPEVRAEAPSAATARGSPPYPRRRPPASPVARARTRGLAGVEHQRGPPGGLGGWVDAAVLCCPTPTRVSTATPSRSKLAPHDVAVRTQQSVRWVGPRHPPPPSKALSTFLGHACVTIPLDRYGHLSRGSEKAASGQRDRCLERSVGGGPA